MFEAVVVSVAVTTLLAGGAGAFAGYKYGKKAVDTAKAAVSQEATQLAGSVQSAAQKL